jgi:hypothetical protein
MWTRVAVEAPVQHVGGRYLGNVPKGQTTERAHAPEVVTKPSPAAVMLFLKHAALEKEWTSADLAVALGIDRSIAKQIAEELTLLGYAELVPRKSDVLRNTLAGNTVAHAKPPRLTRAKADELLTDLTDRAAAFNLQREGTLRVASIVAFGGVNSKHEKIQDVDLGVQFEPKLGHQITDANTKDVMNILRGRSPSLKLHSLQGWPAQMGRVVWEK